MSFKVSHKLYCRANIHRQSVQLLQRWFRQWKRFEELCWSLLFSKNRIVVVPPSDSSSGTICIHLYIRQWLALRLLLFFVAVSVAIAKPYRYAYMNYWDIAILFCLATLLCVLSQNQRYTPLLARILISIPLIVFVLMIILSKSKVYMRKICRACCRFKHYTGTTVESNESSVDNCSTAADPLTQPTSSVFSYGTAESNKPT